MNQRLQHVILFIAAVIGAGWFFIGYPSQDVRSALDYDIQTEKLKDKAMHQFTAFGYSSQNYHISAVTLLANDDLADSLQDDLGRPRTVQVFKENNLKNLKPYYWQVTFTSVKGVPEINSNRSPTECTVGEICLQFDMKGRFMAFINPSNTKPETKIQRKALTAIFAAPADSIKQSLFTSVSDSVLTHLLYFNIDKGTTQDTVYRRKPANRVQNQLLAGKPYQYSANDAQALAHFYLKKTGWELSAFTLDSLFVERAKALDAVNLQYKLKQPLLGQQLSLDLSVTPAGALVYIKANYNEADNEGEEFGAEFIWAFTKQIIILLFALVVGVIFFFRIRSRVVDTRPAVIAAIVIGLVVAAYILLWVVGPRGLLAGPYTTTINIIILIGRGVMAAIACIAAFILFGAGDSITRQFWSEKLSCYNYLRQGMIFNKPVGTAILNAIGLAFVAAGYWTLLLYLFPDLYFSTDAILLSQEAAWPVLRLFTHSVWVSFFVITGIFLVIAGRIYGWIQKKWVVAIPTVVACGLIVVPCFHYGPPWLEFITGVLLGLAFYLIYLKYDFITLTLSYLLFLCLIGSTSGWMLTNSPDLTLFIWTVFGFIVVAAAGIFAIYYGEDEHRLTNYVPDYIEEHANEERIKQELEIAREVQQSFLPKKTPNIKKLDIAAVCKPAFETGGDYYDFIRLDEHRIAVAIGDVSGKGIQSAFYMTYIKGLLHSLSREMVSPAEVLKRANRFFYDNANKSTFISLIYGVIDFQKKTFTFARAGHNPVLHSSISSDSVKELCPNGLGIGLTKEKIFDNKINEIELSITDDDLFLLYTDGITEMLNEDHQFYGTDRLIKLVRELKHQPASTIIQIINNEVTDFIGQAKQHDDMTIMAIRFTQISTINEN